MQPGNLANSSIIIGRLSCLFDDRIIRDGLGGGLEKARPVNWQKSE